jgi:hypothetical protein
MGRDNGTLNTLKPQPGQYDSYNPTFHPLPGEWAKQQLQGVHVSQTTTGSSHASKQPQTEIQRAIAAEKAQHEYWEKWQGVIPGKPVYEDPRAFQNTLLPSARFGTDGRGY